MIEPSVGPTRDRINTLLSLGLSPERWSQADLLALLAVRDDTVRAMAAAATLEDQRAARLALQLVHALLARVPGRRAGSAPPVSETAA